LFEGSALRLVQVTGAGLDRLDQAALMRLGIPVANVTGNDAVAEYAVTAATLLLRRLAWADAEIKRGNYIAFRARMIADNLSGLEGIVVGIVGFGMIGRAVAAAFHRTGARICYHDPAPPTPAAMEAAATLSAKALALDQLLRTADVVSLHVPLLPSTTGCLKAGGLGGAAVDVYSTEPPTADNPLLGLTGEAAQKLLLTPHIAGVTRQASAFLFRSAWDNVERVLVRNEPPVSRAY
jgi:phosphoglycerate dehydrogenase-like enzyme